MIKKSLAASNKYLKIPSERDAWIATTVSSSTAVEGVVIAPARKKSTFKRTAKRK